MFTQPNETRRIAGAAFAALVLLPAAGAEARAPVAQAAGPTQMTVAPAHRLATKQRLQTHCSVKRRVRAPRLSRA